MIRGAAALAPETGTYPSYQVASYTVYPTAYHSASDAPRRDQWCVTVADAGDGWAIRWRSRCMNYRGEWEYEPPAAVRTGEFLKRCRFSEQAALLRARREIDDVIVDGLTFAEYIDRHRAQHRRRARAVLRTQRLRLPGLRPSPRTGEPAPALDAI